MVEGKVGVSEFIPVGISEEARKNVALRVAQQITSTYKGESVIKPENGPQFQDDLQNQLERGVFIDPLPLQDQDINRGNIEVVRILLPRTKDEEEKIMMVAMRATEDPDNPEIIATILVTIFQDLKLTPTAKYIKTSPKPLRRATTQSQCQEFIGTGLKRLQEIPMQEEHLPTVPAIEIGRATTKQDESHLSRGKALLALAQQLELYITKYAEQQEKFYTVFTTRVNTQKPFKTMIKSVIDNYNRLLKKLKDKDIKPETQILAWIDPEREFHKELLAPYFRNGGIGVITLLKYDPLSEDD